MTFSSTGGRGVGSSAPGLGSEPPTAGGWGAVSNAGSGSAAVSVGSVSEAPVPVGSLSPAVASGSGSRPPEAGASFIDRAGGGRPFEAAGSGRVAGALHPARGGRQRHVIDCGAGRTH